ncbi:MAG: hypothetical protein PHR77_10190 [Kiritimatiellae bacterium]|nr:hypothetical protein [Kiritimatiellia bacterium]MDD5522293.1 hypothetical protein [Kiritimatiellia bacterium]
MNIIQQNPITRRELLKGAAGMSALTVFGTRLLTVPAASPVFRAGAATSNITPDLGGAVIGGFVPFPATNVHDELHARCLVLDDGKTRLAIVVCDLLGLSRSLSTDARKLVEEATGIPPQQVLICGVHTHSACSVLEDRPPKSDEPLKGYQAFVARRIADGVKCAANLLRPAELAFVTAEAPEHLFNRRWYMKPGTVPVNPFGIIDKVKMNPPGGSPDLVEPAGPTDPTISILSLREPQGRPIAVLATYSLHYVGGVKHGDISADYYGMFCRNLERLLKAENQDPAFVAMLANGTSGDINNVNFLHPRPKREPYEQMRFVAQDVADKVFKALGKAQYRDRLTLAARYRELPVAYRRPMPEQMTWAKEKLASPEEKSGKTDLPRIYASRMQRLAKQPDITPIPLQILRIGDVCIGTMPNEIFCEIGLEFRKQSPVKPAFLISLAHGYIGYLPTPRHFELGGYETWIGTNQLEPQASEKMMAALLEMAAETKSQP